MRSLALGLHRGPIRAHPPYRLPSFSVRPFARCSNTHGDRATTAAGALRALSYSPGCLNDNADSQARETSTHILEGIENGSVASNVSSKTASEEDATLSESSLGATSQQNARPRSSWTFQQYMFQSDVSVPAPHTTRLVDTQEHADDFALWLDLLRFQKRINGHSGAWKIFKAMRARQKDVPVQGPEAEPFWNAFVLAGQQFHTTEQVWEYAKQLYKRTNQRFEGLYEILVGSSLAKGVDAIDNLRADTGRTTRHEASLWFESAYTWHTLLPEIELYAPGNLKALLPIAKRHGAAMKIVQRIADECGAQDLRQGTVNDTAPATDHEAYEQSDNGADLSQMRLDFEWTPQVTAARDESTSSTPIDYQSGDRNVTVTDDFCARAFATKAFNPSFVIRALGAFGIHSIGPLAMQSLARRCRDLVETYGTQKTDKLDALVGELAQQLENLKTCGVKIQECKYSLLIQKLSSQRDGRVLDAVISSDQHPDSYEDDALQRQIFVSHLSAGYMTQALQALTVITLMGTDPNPTRAAWNILLQTQMRSASRGSLADWRRVSYIFENMLTANVPVSKDTIYHSVSALLPPRQPGKAPENIPSPVDRLSFVTNMWTRIFNSPQQPKILAPRYWHEIQKRFGLENRLEELERLIFLLAQRYSSGPSRDLLAPPQELDNKFVRAIPSMPNFEQSKIDQLFPDRMQKAIIGWYFFSPDGRGGSISPGTQKAPDESAFINVEKWARGVALLQKLKSFGLSVDTRNVREACRQRLLQLFGRRDSRKKRNRRAKASNSQSLRYKVSYLQNLWQPAGSLFAVPEHLLETDSEEADQYLRMIVLEQPPMISQFYIEHDYSRVRGGYVPRRHSLLPTAPPLEDRLRGLKMSMVYEFMNPDHASETHARIEKLRAFNTKFRKGGFSSKPLTVPPLKLRRSNPRPRIFNRGNLR